MDFSQPFSVLNDRLRPQFTTSEQLYSSLTRLEDRQLGSLRTRSTPYRGTVLPEPEPEPEVSETITEPEDDSEPEDLVSDEGSCSDLRSHSCLITELNLKDFGGEELADEDRSVSSSEEKDTPGELSSQRSGEASGSDAMDGDDGSSYQTSYITRTSLPDLINSGRPLSRRRTVGHVSDTLKEVRREVELSRRRSIKLKAQVDKLQEKRDGAGWSQDRERVTEEVLSVLRLLRPLTESESSPPSPSPSLGGKHLDAALGQLQNVARELAINHTIQSKSGKGAVDSGVLQQALRDRDDAIEKKKAMEAELLRSKTELMLLNNQLLEAVQKRLELSLELESWKEDVQLIIQQQLQQQQQAEQAQRKPSRLGILRRNKPSVQRPPTPAAPTTNSNQIFVPRSAAAAPPTPGTPPSTGTKSNWRDKLRRRTGRQEEQDAVGTEPDGFQVISLD
ncbi:bicaudal-D-related protein 2-like [Centropristis striata]|uniref:bicaudal-D-related protein 2-like n=1 Tax=Centropristis striata TaxID=184440 RepID=UPI0027DF58F4|nr:bicaudal-D-related protein 2-like [Centropristis striata]